MSRETEFELIKNSGRKEDFVCAADYLFEEYKAYRDIEGFVFDLYGSGVRMIDYYFKRYFSGFSDEEKSKISLSIIENFEKSGLRERKNSFRVGFCILGNIVYYQETQNESLDFFVKLLESEKTSAGFGKEKKRAFVNYVLKKSAFKFLNADYTLLSEKSAELVNDFFKSLCELPEVMDYKNLLERRIKTHTENLPLEYLKMETLIKNLAEIEKIAACSINKINSLASESLNIISAAAKKINL